MLLDDLSNEELFNHVRSRNLLLERIRKEIYEKLTHRSMSIGITVGNRYYLDSIGEGANKEELDDAVKELRIAGFSVFVDDGPYYSWNLTISIPEDM